jgi:hypothetical protein
VLVGRDLACSRVDKALADARRGICGTLLVRGPAGIGKTALCRYATERADGMAVLMARGVEAESRLPFAGLSELFRGALRRLDSIPRAQGAAIAQALALDPPKPAGSPEDASRSDRTVVATNLQPLPVPGRRVPAVRWWKGQASTCS